MPLATPKTPSSTETIISPGELTRRKAFQAGYSVMALGALAGCATPAAVTTAATSASTALSAAVTLWGIAKGIGEVALASLAIVNPPAAAIVNAAIALVDPLISAGTADAALVTSQAHAVILAAAPVVTVVQNAVPAVAATVSHS